MDASLLDTQWIWHPEWIDHGAKSAGGFVHFRKHVELDAVPASPLHIQITADTKYKLYVNRKMLHAGPVKGDENLWFYDEIDVQPFLKIGKNRINVKVLRFYYATTFATSFPRLPIPGLFVRTSDLNLRDSYGLQTDDSWECALDPTTLMRIDQEEDDFLNIYEDVDARKEAALVWMRAKPLSLPKSHGLAPPWILSPRMIPLSRSSNLRVKAIHNVRSSLSQDEWEALLRPSNGVRRDLRLPSGTSHHLEIDAGHHVTAILSFVFQRPLTPGSTLRITYSECYEDKPEQVPYIRRKENRIDTTKQLYGPQDTYLFAGIPGAKGAEDLAYAADERSVETFSPFHFRTLRFLALDIDVARDSDLVMKRLEMRETNYPLEVTGKIDIPTSDPHADTYNRIWQNSVRTLTNCMHDCYEDCPFYEQLQYAMDVRSSGLFTYAISGDDRLARQAIIQLHNTYRPELGLLASRGPAHQSQIIPHFSLFWICTVTDHFDHFADVYFTRRFISTCDSVLEYFARRIDPIRGLVASGEKELGTTWDFVDWAPEWKPMGVPPQSTGFQTFTSLLYAYTLQNVARILRFVGRPSLAEEYDARANVVLKAVREHCWNGTWFTDGLAYKADHTYHISEHNQIWAVLAGAVTDDESRSLLSRTFAPAPCKELGSAIKSVNLTKASTAMSIYTLRAVSKVGGSLYDDMFHAFWDPWRHQISQNLTTWCEDNVTLRSDCHAWSAVPLYEFMAEVAGVTAAAPGWKSINFKPRVSLFQIFDAQVPLGGHLKPGIAHVSWAREVDEGSTRVLVKFRDLPAGEVMVNVVYPDGHVEERSGPDISINFVCEIEK